MPPSQCGRPVELSCGDDWPPLSPSSKKCSLGRPSILHLPVLVLQLSRSTSTTSRRTGDLWAGLTSSTLRPLPICVPRLCGKKVCWQAVSDVENQLSIGQQVGDFKGASISYLSVPGKCPRMSYQDQCIARYLSKLHKKMKGWQVAYGRIQKETSWSELITFFLEKQKAEVSVWSTLHLPSTRNIHWHTLCKYDFF